MRHCETKPGKARFCLSFLTALLIVVFLCPSARAQYRPSSADIPSLEEEQILMLQHAISRGSQDPNYRNELSRRVIHYMRDACKRDFQGDWAFAIQGDVITIVYDEQHQVFLGRVKHIVQFDPDVVKPGYLLFKVYFPHMSFGMSGNKPWTLGDLRSTYGSCRTALHGTEYSFKLQGGVKVKTQGPVAIRLTGDLSQIQYQQEKYSGILNRLIRR